MNFFLDENFPRHAIDLLRKSGHRVFDIRGTEKEGLEDQLIFGEAQKHKAIFLATDRDFFHTIPFIYPRHCGIIVISLSQPNRKNIIEKLEIALRFIETNAIESACLLLSDKNLSHIKKG